MKERKKYEKNRLNKLMKYKTKKKYGTIKRKNESRKKPIIPNRVINLLASKNFQEHIDVYENKVKIDIPVDFSLISNPEQSIRVLKQMFYAIMNLKIEEIEMDYSKCEKLGLCASSITDIIIINGKQYRRIMNRKIVPKGNFPKTAEAREIFIISGLINHLNLSRIEKENVIKLDIIKNEEQGVLCEKVIDYYDKCLNTQNYQLTKEGKQQFGNMIGEVIDNANQHGGRLVTWYTAGHFNLEKRNNRGKCRLVLFDFGDSIYENLKSEETTSYTKKLLKEKSQRHRRLFNNKWTEEALWTLYALQYNVSRKRIDENDNRGKGTIKLIDSFMKIGKNSDGDEPLMALFSGRSHILFDGTYKLSINKIEDKEVQIIAFNESNSIDERPDPKYVRRIEQNFPGTMISMEFYLDKKYIEKQVEDRND
ncbi:MAG: hypothetical protein HFJ20_02600 [Clostridia bacterium]|nr:hypothetical protein [Clostridia bacterium]